MRIGSGCTRKRTMRIDWSVEKGTIQYRDTRTQLMHTTNRQCCPTPIYNADKILEFRHVSER